MTEKISVAGRRLDVTHPDRILFPDARKTKRDLVDYYARIAEIALPHWRGRPVTMQRFPDGVDRDGFYQKNAPEYFPDWIRRAELVKENGTTTYVVASEAATMAYLATQGCITPHLGLARTDRPNHPDRLIFDLDPSDSDFAKVREAARRTRDLLARLDCPAYVQTTGSRGFHVVVPLDRTAPFDRVRALARRITERLAGEAPDLLTVEQRRGKRGSQVFLDYLRNAYGQTAVAPYAVRARPEAPVATPLDWSEALGSAGPRDYRLENIFRRLGQKADPWRGMDARAISARALEDRLDGLSRK